LGAAYREAQISVEVARQRGRTAAATYEDAGIVGLLLSLRDDADVRKLVRTIFGPLLDPKPADRDRLLSTLGVFFEENCSRIGAAQRLGVHEKSDRLPAGKD
jgi:sugar diacid utilization regulator